MLHLPGPQSDSAVLQELLVKCDESRQELANTIVPWRAKALESTRLTVARARERYIEEFGDPDSPEFEAELTRLQAYFASPDEDDDGP